MPNDSTVSDLAIVLMLLEADCAPGIRLLLETHGGKVLGALNKRYKGVLAEAEIKSAFNLAIAKLVKYAPKYDESKGPLGGVFYVFARNAAVSVLRGEQKHYQNRTDFDEILRNDLPGDTPCDELPPDSKRGKILADFEKAIASLPPVQQAVVRADLKADGQADAVRLAETLACSKNSIYVNRNRAHEYLRQRMIALGHYRD
jgi:DNA-directed RNA polymerase specialized sigma24 family protein